MDRAEIPSISAVLILDNEGKRIVARQYGAAANGDHTAFEKKLFDKTARTNAKSEAEIIILDSFVSVYRNTGDAWFYVIGTQMENELILVEVLNAMTEALSTLLRGSLDTRLLLDNFDTVLITIDEMIDCGMILETEATAIANRVGMKAADATPASEAAAGGTFSESNFNSMFASAREQLARSLLK